MKNMMLDTWDNKIFYPRFYDCDTICSYDNSGQLKFDVDIEMEQGYWNTSSSRLWTRIRDLFHDELIEVYNKMRQNGLSYESLMNCFYGEQIAKIPQTYYNKDYDVKYAPFADSYIGMANGDTYEHLKRWLSQRLRFVDTLFDYAPSYNNDVLTIRANTTELMRLEIETYTPVYQHLSWYNNQMDKKKIDGKISVEFTGKAMTETDQEVLIYGGSNVKSIKGIQSMNPNRMLIGSATRLIELDASNCPLLADINANKANLAPHVYLNKVNLSGCPLLGGNLIVNQSPLIREIDIRNTGITGLNLPSNLKNLEVLKLPSVITNIVLNDASQLHTLELDEGCVMQSVSMTNCNALTNVTNFNLENVSNVTLNNSYNIVNELYFSKTTNLSISNMPNLERIVYTPNAEHEVFDKANVDNTSNYTVSTFNCPNLNEFITTAPYRNSYNNCEIEEGVKQYPPKQPDQMFIANKLDLSNTQFTDIKMLCTTDTNELILPKTTKSIIIDSAYDLDTHYLTDGDYDTIHTDLAEYYENDYEDEILLNGQTPNIVPTASDGSLIYSMHTSDKQAEEGIWNLDGLILDELHALGLNNDVKLVDNTLSMPNRTDNYSNLIENAMFNGTVAKYTATNNNTFPIFNEGIKYKSNIIKNKEVYEYVLILEDKEQLPSSISFRDKSNLLTVEYLNISNVTTMNSMFNGCSKLTSLDVSDWDTSKVTNMSYMFYNCNNLISLDVSNFNTSNVTDMSYMFNGCNLTSIDVSNFDTSKVTNMSYMFYYCSKLTSIEGIGEWDTSNVTNMSYMFNNCEQLTDLDLSNFDSSKVTNMCYMFQGCESLTNLDVSNFDTTKVTDMSYMFNGCKNLTSLNVSGWDTSSVTNMYQMFSGCSGLTSLDASGWDTSSVTNMYQMFSGCSGLTSLDASGWDTSSVTNMGYMFQSCNKLTSLNVEMWPLNDLTQTAINSLPAGNGINNEIYASANFTVPTGWTLIYTNPYDIAIYTCKVSGVLPTFNTDYTGYSVEEINNGDGTYTTYIRTNDLYIMPTQCSFRYKTSLLSVEKLKVTSNVSDMSNMFYNCNSLTSLEGIGEWDTSSVTNMGSMFYGCRNLTSLNVSNFNTSNVTDMSNMFYSCNKLTSLDVSSFDTSKVTNMSYMFYDCSRLTSLDLSGFNTAKVTNMGTMFQNCNSLTSLEGIGEWDTSSVTNMGSMFTGCSRLTSLDVSGFNTSKVTNMSNMFYSCNKLTSLEGIGEWDTSSVTNMSYTFYNCNNLTNLDVSSFNTSNVTDMSSMFDSCNNLTSLDLSSFDTYKVTNMSNMFSYCNNLTSLDSMMNISISLNLSNTSLDTSSLLDVIDNLATVTTAQTLSLGTTLLAKLTEEQIAVATNKGWTVQ